MGATMSPRELRAAQLKNGRAKILYIRQKGKVGMQHAGWAQLRIRQQLIQKAIDAKNNVNAAKYGQNNQYRQNKINVLGELNQTFAAAKVHHNVSDLSETKAPWYGCKTCKDTGKVTKRFLRFFWATGKKPCPRCSN